jgi:hypothetical protein
LPLATGLPSTSSCQLPSIEYFRKYGVPLMVCEGRSTLLPRADGGR